MACSTLRRRATHCCAGVELAVRETGDYRQLREEGINVITAHLDLRWLDQSLVEKFREHNPYVFYDR